jgi:hypothetical protein
MKRCEADNGNAFTVDRTRQQLDGFLLMRSPGARMRSASDHPCSGQGLMDEERKQLTSS